MISHDQKAPKGAGQKVLYLDFDGVLHHENCLWSPKRGPYLDAPPEHTLFQHAELLAELLRPYPDLKIVLSTSWVRSYGCTGTAKRLPIELRSRVIGATWHSANKHVDQEWISAPRGMQVWGDVVRRQPAAWLALDDDYLGWPAWALGNFVRTDEVEGISHRAVQPIIERKLQEMYALPGNAT